MCRKCYNNAYTAARHTHRCHKRYETWNKTRRSGKNSWPTAVQLDDDDDDGGGGGGGGASGGSGDGDGNDDDDDDHDDDGDCKFKGAMAQGFCSVSIKTALNINQVPLHIHESNLRIWRFPYLKEVSATHNPFLEDFSMTHGENLKQKDQFF